MSGAGTRAVNYLAGRKWEAARNQSEADLFRALAALADLEIKRKSGGIPADLGIETFLGRAGRARSMRAAFNL